MRRSILVILLVAALSAWIARAEQIADGDSPTLKPAAAPPESTWVRTAHGWQPRTAIVVEQRTAPPLDVHPALFAAFQLGASLLALIVFPARAARVAPAAAPHRIERRRHRRASASAP